MSSQVGQMSNRLSSVIWSVIAGVLVFAGCEMQSVPQQVDVLAIGPGVDTIGVVSEDAEPAIAAAGGS